MTASQSRPFVSRLVGRVSSSRLVRGAVAASALIGSLFAFSAPAAADPIEAPPAYVAHDRDRDRARWEEHRERERRDRYRWEPAHWVQTRRGWVMVPGHWERRF